VPTQEEMTILLKAKDQAKQVLSKSQGQLEKYNKAIKGVGIGIAAAGVAVEAMARKLAPMNEATKKLAAQTGLTEGEIRGMATSLSNATFPLNEAIELMTLAAQQGLEGADALQEYANFWDMVGDASGLSSVELAKAGAALKSVGVEAGNETEILGALGLVTNNSTATVGEFLTSISRMSPELQRYGISVNEAAVIMTALERELGVTARAARTEFKEAMEQSQTGLTGVFEKLGLTESQLVKYRDQLAESTGIIQINAEAHAATKTRLEELQSSFGDVLFTMGPFIQQAAGIAPVMLVVGPLMAAFGPITATAMTIARTATRLFGLAVKTAMGPAGLVILAIGAAIAIGILLWKNWETIKEKAVAVFGFIADFFSNIWARIVGIFRASWKIILSILFPPVGIALLVKENWEKIVGFVTSIWDQVKQVVQSAMDFIMDKVNIVLGAIDKVRGAAGAVGGFFGSLNPFAKGGPISAGEVALVGERGPELFTSRTSGTIIPNSAIGGGSGSGGITIVGPLIQAETVVGGDLEDLLEQALDNISRRTGKTIILAGS